MAKIGSVSSNFTTMPSGSPYLASSNASASGGLLRIYSPDAYTQSWFGVRGDLTNSYAAIQFIGSEGELWQGSGSNGLLSVNTEYSYGDNACFYFTFYVEGGVRKYNIQPWYTWDDYTVEVSGPMVTGIREDAGYWYRFREASGTFYWEYSADGYDWIQLFSASSTDVFRAAPTDVYFQAEFSSNIEDQPATAYFDNLNNLPAPTAPTVTTSPVSNVDKTTATGNGNVSNSGGSTITERGVCWSTTSNPTTANSKATASGTTGAFSVSMTGLTANTTYYARAYAINGVGTSYGAQVSFTTLPPSTTVNNTRNALITGRDTSNAQRSATLLGAINVTDQRNAHLKGIGLSQDQRNVHLKGIVKQQDERGATLIANDKTSETRQARLKGVIVVNSERSATLLGFMPVATAEKESIMAGGDGWHRERFDNQAFMSPQTTAAWGGGKVEMH